MSEQNCVLACGLGQGRLRAAIGRSFTTVRLAVPEISLLAAALEISTAARFATCLLPPQAADVCRNVIYINFVLRHPMYRLAAALRCPKFLARCRFAKFRPLHVSRLAFFRRRRRQGVKPLSNQNKKALRRSARRIGIRSRLRARSGTATGVHRTVIHYRPPCGARNFFARCRFAKFRPLHVSRLAFFRHRRRQGAKPRSNPLHIKREKHFCEVLFSFGSRIGIRTPTYRVRVCCATVTQFGCICF